jgi:hypothetical protein
MIAAWLASAPKCPRIGCVGECPTPPREAGGGLNR